VIDLVTTLATAAILIVVLVALWGTRKERR
jgi:hypothetical protein